MSNFEKGFKPLPFKGELEDSGFKTGVMKEKILQFKDDPEIVVGIVESKPEERKENIKRAGKAKVLFEELRNKYDINVPEFEYIIGQDEAGEEKLFIKTEKIHESENVALDSPDEQNEKLDKLYSGLLNYLGDKYENKEDFLNDIFNVKQYKYGHKKGEADDNYYLVDVDPWVFEFDKETQGKNYYMQLALSLRWIEEEAKEIEIQSGKSFDKKNLLLSQIPERLEYIFTDEFSDYLKNGYDSFLESKDQLGPYLKSFKQRIENESNNSA